MKVNQIYDSAFIFLAYMTHINFIDKLSNMELIKQKLVGGAIKIFNLNSKVASRKYDLVSKVGSIISNPYDAHT